MARGHVRVSAGAVGDFAALARDLRRAGAKSLQKELYAGLQRSGRPAVQAAQESAEKTLPSGRGAYSDGGSPRRSKRKGRHAGREGLGQRVANASYRTKLTSRRGLVRLSITATEKAGKSVDVEALDGGRLRHPLFGNKAHWYQQAVPQGWFTRPMQEQTENVVKELERAVERVTEQINRG